VPSILTGVSEQHHGPGAYRHNGIGILHIHIEVADGPRTVSVDPRAHGRSNLIPCSALLVAGVAGGEITPSEAGELGKLLDSYVRLVESAQLAERVANLERIITNESAPR
jgi:hypothetical protein